MRRIVAVLLLAAAVPAAAVTPDTAVMAPINVFLDAFNKGDTKTAATMMVAGGGAIVDEFAPYQWSGPTAMTAWAADFGRDATARGVSDGRITLGAPTRSEVGATSAYVVTPAHYSFKQKGVAMVEDGSLTFALVKGKASKMGAWKIAAWTWSGPPPKPGK